MSKRTWTEVNPTGSELDAKLKAAGIGRSTFYARRKSGASVDQALVGPETTGPGKSEVRPDYHREVERAVELGLLKSADEAPPIPRYTRNLKRGMSPRIAVLARSRWTYKALQALRDEQRPFGSKHATVYDVLHSTTYKSYLTSLYEQSSCMTPDQFYTIALMLTRVNNKNDNTRGKPAQTR